MKHIKQILKTLLLTIMFSAFAQTIDAQTYSVSYDKEPIEKVISDLRKRTGYEFVYQKQVVQGVPHITCTYKNLSLQQLLNRVLLDQAGIDYEIMKKSIILRKVKKNAQGEYFKKRISGMVSDQNGDPLIGVTVVQKGTSNGATTDADGTFLLLVEGTQPELDFTYIGFRSQSVKITDKTPFIMLKLSPDETILDEVLVTGYQNIKREDATGSYQLISSKDLEKRYTSSIVENLEGQIPGLVSYNNGINGGGENALTIRGVSSFEARTNPLVVVDGLPIEGSIETINPYNIENITVLKDAAAVSIYGARASNGVIVVTTKKAHQEKVSIDFNADLTISEKQNYDNYNWISGSQLIDLEQYNFNAMKSDANQSAFESLKDRYQSNYRSLTPVMRLLMNNYLGNLNDADLQSQIARLRQNDYRKEYQNLYERQNILQQYNLGLRTRGKALSSNIQLNYKGDNLGATRSYDRTLTFSYHGDWQANKWLTFAFGTNVISGRSKKRYNPTQDLAGINGFLPYQSMYNEDGTPADLEGFIYSGEEALQNSAYGLKSVGYNPVNEENYNFTKSRNTNIRSFISGTVDILPGWTATAHFQYEDIYSKSSSYVVADSYDMRYLYDIYTMQATEMTTGYDPDTWEEIQIPTQVIKHYIPEGGMLRTNIAEEGFYTFRAQTAYNHTFADKHDISVLGGFEYRQTHTKSNGNILMGYDEQTQTNRNGMVDYNTLKNVDGTASVLGPNYTAYGAPEGTDFSTTDVLHRFYSLYANGNYTYDHRYSASFSYRVDKTDLFGADPKFRGRPLWSVGASWNMMNEKWMKPYTWVDALKLRASYGLTGNIDSNVSSYLTATLANEFIYGNLGSTLDTPPNDQLRWEKTANFNLGLDFSLFANRLSGSLDFYHRKGTDLLTTTDLDPTTGWTQLTINNGEMVNKGVELQLNSDIIHAATRNDIDFSAAFNLAYNKNEVTEVYHAAASGYEQLYYNTLHKGYPVHALFGYDFAGIAYENGIQYITWRDHKGEIHQSEVSSADFTPEDAVYCGSLDPKITMNFTPQLSWKGFTISAMFSYYGGHYMRANVSEWNSPGSATGYNDGAINAAMLNYWTSGDHTAYLANGYLSTGNIVGQFDTQYMNSLVVPADYLKLRNLVIGYDFPMNITRALGVNALRLRLQMNNVCTWARNQYGIDPEANDPLNGTELNKTPRSYTFSLFVNL